MCKELQFFQKNKNHQAAIDLLLESLEHSEELLEVWCLLGMEYMILEDYSKATEYFKLCIEQDPEDYQVLYNLLFCLNSSENTIKLLMFSIQF